MASAVAFNTNRLTLIGLFIHLMIFLIYFFPAHVQCTSKKRKKVKLSGQLVLLILNFKETLTQKKINFGVWT